MRYILTYRYRGKSQTLRRRNQCRMVSEQKQIRTLQDRILNSFNPTEVTALLDQLEAFRHIPLHVCPPAIVTL